MNQLGDIDCTSLSVNGVDVGSLIGAPDSIGGVEAISGNATLSVATGLALVTCSGSNITVTLPSLASATRVVRVKKMDATDKQVIISGTIDGASSITLSGQYETVELYPGPSEWSITGRFN